MSYYRAHSGCSQAVPDEGYFSVALSNLANKGSYSTLLPFGSVFQLRTKDRAVRERPPFGDRSGKPISCDKREVLAALSAPMEIDDSGVRLLLAQWAELQEVEAASWLFASVHVHAG